MSEDTTLLIAKQKLMHRYRCTDCGNIHSNIGDMVFDIIENQVYCYSCAGYSAPLQIIPDPYAAPPSEVEMHSEKSHKESILVHA